MAVQLHTHPEHVLTTAQYIFNSAQVQGQITGHRIRHILRAGAAAALRGTEWDPMEENLGYQDIVAWVDDHLVFNDNGEIIALIAGDQVLWEDS